VLDHTQLRGRAGASRVAAAVAAAIVLVLALSPVRVEAVPDQRANSAGGRRASTVGNDSLRASTRALNVAIVEAAQRGDIEEVTELLSDGADVNGVVPGDGTPLLVAARGGHRTLVGLLLDRGADVNAAVPGDGNALIMAASRGHLDIVTMLLNSGALIDEVVPGDENALIGASGSGHLDVVRLLVGRGANVNARVWAEQGWPERNGEWRTPLSMALRGGHTSVVRYLQSVGAVE
jgi:ankyrin repeat protein